MNELEDKINAILSDSSQMEMITRLASQLMGGGEKEHSAPPLPSGDGELMAKLGKILSAAGGESDKTALLHAMEPYLGEKRRSKMARAIRFAHLANIARIALKEYGGGGDL